MSRPPLEVADLIRSAGAAFIERNRQWIRWKHVKVLLAIARCRTAVPGGHIDQCTRCGQRALSLCVLTQNKTPFPASSARPPRHSLALVSSRRLLPCSPARSCRRSTPLFSPFNLHRVRVRRNHRRLPSNGVDSREPTNRYESARTSHSSLPWNCGFSFGWLTSLSAPDGRSLLEKSVNPFCGVF